MMDILKKLIFPSNKLFVTLGEWVSNVSPVASVVALYRMWVDEMVSKKKADNTSL